jgi:hypothetical protein
MASYFSSSQFSDRNTKQPDRAIQVLGLKRRQLLLLAEDFAEYLAHFT